MAAQFTLLPAAKVIVKIFNQFRDFPVNRWFHKAFVNAFGLTNNSVIAASLNP
jgi:hypothetical protein